MRRDSFLVTDDGSTPEKPLERCLYCAAAVGSEHEPRCAMRRRTVVLRAEVDYVCEIPEHWTAGDTDAFYNSGTWCADNLPADFKKHVGSELCLCDSTTIRFLREADADDELASAVRVADFRD